MNWTFAVLWFHVTFSSEEIEQCLGIAAVILIMTNNLPVSSRNFFQKSFDVSFLNRPGSSSFVLEGKKQGPENGALLKSGPISQDNVSIIFAPWATARTEKTRQAPHACDEVKHIRSLEVSLAAPWPVWATGPAFASPACATRYWSIHGTNASIGHFWWLLQPFWVWMSFVSYGIWRNVSLSGLPLALCQPVFNALLERPTSTASHDMKYVTTTKLSH